MRVRNIFNSLNNKHDERGLIADVFANDAIHHVAVIRSDKGAVRGNHYHKDTTQHVLCVVGVMEYWYAKIGEPPQMYLANVGDLITSEANEVHAMRMLSTHEMMVFSSGVRGGEDYEKDTFRVASIVKAAA